MAGDQRAICRPAPLTGVGAALSYRVQEEMVASDNSVSSVVVVGLIIVAFFSVRSCQRSQVPNIRSQKPFEDAGAVPFIKVKSKSLATLKATPDCQSAHLLL